jgi:hypothetical protein
MELGFALPHLGPIATRDNIRQLSIEAERLGYHSLWTNERLLKPVHPKTPYPGNRTVFSSGNTRRSSSTSRR